MSKLREREARNEDTHQSARSGAFGVTVRSLGPKSVTGPSQETS
jgi:hypothetical protein